MGLAVLRGIFKRAEKPVVENVRANSYITLGYLIPTDMTDKHDPINRLETRVGLNLRGDYIKYNYVFNNEFPNDWAEKALSRDNSYNFTVSEERHTHDIECVDGENFYLPVNKDQWKRWGVEDDGAGVWRLDLEDYAL